MPQRGQRSVSWNRLYPAFPYPALQKGMPDVILFHSSRRGAEPIITAYAKEKVVRPSHYYLPSQVVKHRRAGRGQRIDWFQLYVKTSRLAKSHLSDRTHAAAKQPVPTATPMAGMRNQ